MMFDVINTCATCAMLCWASVIRHEGQVCYAMLGYATGTAAIGYARTSITGFTNLMKGWV